MCWIFLTKVVAILNSLLLKSMLLYLSIRMGDFHSKKHTLVKCYIYRHENAFSSLLLWGLFHAFLSAFLLFALILVIKIVLNIKRLTNYWKYTIYMIYLNEHSLGNWLVHTNLRYNQSFCSELNQCVMISTYKSEKNMQKSHAQRNLIKLFKSKWAMVYKIIA